MFRQGALGSGVVAVRETSDLTRPPLFQLLSQRAKSWHVLSLTHANIAVPFRTAQTVMWELVQRYTGKVEYQRGVKSEGLSAEPPVIDCSGWVALLLTAAMEAENEAAREVLFSPGNIAALHAWSDRIISEIETRTGFILEGSEINVESLPRCATIGLKMGEPAWATNYPRPRGITHIVQIVRRPEDGAGFVSKAIGLTPSGIRLTPLKDWLFSWWPDAHGRDAWAVDPFRLSSSR